MSANDHLWRIDSLEARAGLAFGSCRRSLAFFQGGLPDLDRPAFFIAAPDFEPELISSGSLGFSAARHGFQEGLFYKDFELGFKNQRSLIEFVRRCYLRGSSGDGTDGGDDRPLPPTPPPAPPDIDLPPTDDVETEDSLADGLLKDTMNFAEVSKALGVPEEGRVVSDGYTWPELKITQGNHRSPVAFLQRSADEILLLLLIGVERWRDGLDSLRWHRALADLLYVYQRLHLNFGWYFRMKHWENVLKSNPQALEFFRFLTDYNYYRDYRNLHSENENSIFDVLGRLPLPHDLSRLVNPNAPDTASLRDLLSIFVSSPQSILALPASRPRVAIELVLLAAAYLTHTDMSLPASLRQIPAGTVPDFPHGLELRWALHRAAGWLGEQMPRQAFPHAVEEMIGQAASITWRK